MTQVSPDMVEVAARGSEETPLTKHASGVAEAIRTECFTNSTKEN